MVGPVVLVEVALVVGGVDDDLAGGNVRGHAVLREAAPDAEHDVGFLEEVVDRPRHHAGARTEREGMTSNPILISRVPRAGPLARSNRSSAPPPDRAPRTDSGSIGG